MGYFFRPFIYSIINNCGTLQGQIELMKEMDKHMNFGTRYRLEWEAKKEDGTRYEDPMWRSWGWVSQSDHYKEFMNKIFDVKNGEYYKPLYTRKFEGNKDFHTTQEVLKLCDEFKTLIETDPSVDWDWDEERPRLIYILKGPWNDWTAW